MLKPGKVSIPSNGSIQFLRRLKCCVLKVEILSQSPQTGQFNSYEGPPLDEDDLYYQGLNPLKRVNSILTEAVEEFGLFNGKGLNPLKRVNSILTWKVGLRSDGTESLNPLKRVNSILTRLESWSSV